MMRNQSHRARFGPFEVDLHTRELWKFGTRLKLVGQPFEILGVLLDRPGELVTREELHSRLWPADTFVDFNHGLNAAVNKLREALSDSAERPRYVETLPRRGYRFIALVEWIPQVSAAVVPVPTITPAIPPEPSSLQASVPTITLQPVEVETQARKRWPLVVIGAGLVFVLLVVTTALMKMVAKYETAFGHPAIEERTKPLAVTGALEPAFSPDGNYLAFVRYGNEAERGIFVSAVDGDHPMQLTRDDDDSCPVWSPDGQWIAFSRTKDKEISIYAVRANGEALQKRTAKTATPQTAAFTLTSLGTDERKFDTHGVAPQHNEIDWSPDGKSIAFSGLSGIYLLSVEGSSVHRLTEAPPATDDWGPSFSPDGQRLLFVRTHQLGLPDEIWVASTTGNEAHRVLAELGKIASPPRFSYDGASVIFSSNRSGHPALWRASLDAPDSIAPLGAVKSWAWDPAISRRGYRLAYERITRSLSVWEMDVATAGEKRPHVVIAATSDTDQGPGPQYSPDGQKLAYMSDRSGTMEIWIANRDGTNPFQLTAVGDAGTPRWSPESQSIVFDASTNTGSKIVTINVHGGAPQVLTPDSFHNVCPSWSNDGKWIYFGSTRSGDWQVWKIAPNGGTPVQVTRHGGHAALESKDGKYLYYSKTSQAEPEIWQVPIQGGPETQVSLVRPGTWASWQTVQGGIFFVGPSLGHQAALSFYDSTRHRTTTVAVLERTPFWLGATADGRTIAFDQPGQEQAEAMLVENFR
jgi:Tol biopolymer transport system component/DNA-binding winged helix-turn-helix (wHTH) protein